MRGEHGIQHLHDGPLLGGGQCLDAFKLLRDLGLRPAFAGGALRAGRADQFLDGDTELVGAKKGVTISPPWSIGTKKDLPHPG